MRAIDRFANRFEIVERRDAQGNRYDPRLINYVINAFNEQISIINCEKSLSFLNQLRIHKLLLEIEMYVTSINDQLVMPTMGQEK